MLGYVLRRLLWLGPTLFGISVLTFVVLDLVPGDRAMIEVVATDESGRAEAVRALRARYGLIDAQGRERSVAERYLAWLSHAARLDFAGPNESSAAFAGRFGRALAVSGLVGALALTFAFGIGVPLGAWLGRRRGRRVERLVTGGMLTVQALPDFLVATLALLFLAGGLGVGWFPPGALRTEGIDELGVAARVADLAWHLALPVAVVAVGPLAVVARFVADSMERAGRADFAVTLRAWGLPARAIRRRVLRNALAPAITLFGVLLPITVVGSVVVENVFALPGVGRLGFLAVLARRPETVMAVTLTVALVTSLAATLADLLHRAVDPRVELR